MRPLRPRAVSIERWPSVENPHAASPKGLSQKALKNIAAKSPHALNLSASYIIPLTRNNRNSYQVSRLSTDNVARVARRENRRFTPKNTSYELLPLCAASLGITPITGGPTWGHHPLPALLYRELLTLVLPVKALIPPTAPAQPMRVMGLRVNGGGGFGLAGCAIGAFVHNKLASQAAHPAQAPS